MPLANNNQPQDYIGSGIAFPGQTSVTGGLLLSSSTRNLEESIWIILTTDIGERVYRPDFGSRLSELVFAPLNRETLLLLRLYVEEALEMWEPRIILKEVRTNPDPIRGMVELEIIYQPKNSFESRSFVYPFYLEASS